MKIENANRAVTTRLRYDELKAGRVYRNAQAPSTYNLFLKTTDGHVFLESGHQSRVTDPTRPLFVEVNAKVVIED